MKISVEDHKGHQCMIEPFGGSRTWKVAGPCRWKEERISVYQRPHSDSASSSFHERLLLISVSSLL
jgi:hypothetical protein